MKEHQLVVCAPKFSAKSGPFGNNDLSFTIVFNWSAKPADPQMEHGL